MGNCMIIINHHLVNSFHLTFILHNERSSIKLVKYNNIKGNFSVLINSVSIKYFIAVCKSIYLFTLIRVKYSFYGLSSFQFSFIIKHIYSGANK